jgi:hypothetical protein
MTVFVDPSTGSVDLAGLLPRGGFVVTDLFLPNSNNRSDVAWFGNGPGNRSVYIGVERKRLGDALTCMQDGRLVEQLRGMVDQYDYIWVVIEDEVRPAPKTGLLEKLLHDRTKNMSRHYQCNSKCKWYPAMAGRKRKIMWRDFHHWLGTITHGVTAVSGRPVRTWFTRTPWETADWVWSEYNWWQKSWDEHKSLNVFDESHERLPKGFMYRPPIEAYIAKQFDEVGWDKAIAACDFFPSPRALANGTAEDWLRVPGFDRKAKNLDMTVAEYVVQQWMRERVLPKGKRR